MKSVIDKIIAVHRKGILLIDVSYGIYNKVSIVKPPVVFAIITSNTLVKTLRQIQNKRAV